MTRNPSRAARTARSAVLAAATLIGSAGCTREFFRNWADQDVTEAVFEKSRDPRFRLDLFTIEPPALSRFADPYDPENPPAPPDDLAAEALSPTPQWPRHRLMTPVEGTGYLDLLEEWKRTDPPPQTRDVTADTGPSAEAPPEPPPLGGQPPFGRGNFGGPGDRPMSLPSPEGVPPRFQPDAAPGDPRAEPPSNLPDGPNAPLNPSERPGESLPDEPPDGRASTETLQQSHDRDPDVLAARFQVPETEPLAFPEERALAQVPEDAQIPEDLDSDTDLDLDAGLNQDAEVPEPLEPGQAPGDPRAPALEERTQDQPEALAPETVVGEAGQEEPSEGRSLLEMLQPETLVFDEAKAAGLPPEIEPYVIDPRKALTLALQNSRAYQFRLEDIYISALNTTLQRFRFEPQTFAGLSPGAPTAGSFSGIVTPGTQFLFRTEETGTPTSMLDIGTTAGIGKLLSFGTTLVGSFANQTIINFGGPNAVETTSESFLPLGFVVPLLRDGGRAVTMENLTQAERNLLYDIRQFGRFRKEFLLNILVGQNVTGGGPADPTVGYLQLLTLLLQVENNSNNVAGFQRVLQVFRELGRGAGANVAPLDITNVELSLQQERNRLIQSSTQYRNQLDQFKQQLGLPPDLPVIPDSSLLRPFRRVFLAIDNLEEKNRFELERLVDDLPRLQDVVIAGQPVIEPYRRADDIARQRRPYQEQLAERRNRRLELNNQIRILQDQLDPTLPPEVEERIQRQIEELRDELLQFRPEDDEADRAMIDELFRREQEAFQEAEEQLESVVRAAVRVALANRLDLMNARGQLYDSWRQLAVTANQLKGVLTTSGSFQNLTPPTTNNPFGFDSQTSQFSIGLRAELPLIRLQERNDFVQAHIDYNRARRALMQTEDSIKTQVRSDVRNLQLQYVSYQISKTAYVIAVITLDQSFLQFLQPATAGGGGGGNQLVLTLLRGLQQGVNAQNALISDWVNYQTLRLVLYRDLGTMPYDEWEAFYELFPAANGADGRLSPERLEPEPAAAEAGRPSTLRRIAGAP